MIGERPDRDRARVLGAAACVASALLLEVPIPETASAGRLKCQRYEHWLGWALELRRSTDLSIAKPGSLIHAVPPPSVWRRSIPLVLSDLGQITWTLSRVARPTGRTRRTSANLWPRVRHWNGSA